MKFITREEVNFGKFDYVLTDTSSENDSIIAYFELAAIDLITSYLSTKYDTDLIFSQTGSKRSPMMMKMVNDFIICYLVERSSTGEIPESVTLMCTRNTQWLDKVSKGDLNANLPLLDDELDDVSTVGFQFGSDPIFNNTDNID